MIDLPNLKKNVPLAPLTTYKIGGPAEFFVEVHSADELANAVVAARTERMPYFILGCGANILIRDGGVAGLTILNRAAKTELLPQNCLRAESGATIADLIELTANHELSGLEHFAGIPSTVGGAIWQNLHFLVPDRQGTVFIESVIESARILTRQNEVREVNKDFFEFGYDTSLLHRQEVIVLDVTFKLKTKPGLEIRQQIAANLAWRRARQPQLEDFPSCGSVFKKIVGVGAGRLIDQAGLKGKTIGGAQISPQHANFIVNLGNAKAADVSALIELAKTTIRKKFGQNLEPEISIIGEE